MAGGKSKHSEAEAEQHRPVPVLIHESLQDNKPMDRFVTELIMMEGINTTAATWFWGGHAE